MAPRSRSFQITATPVTIFAHLLFIAVTTLVLVWLLQFRGGLAFRSDNKEKILNVHTFLMVVGFILFGGEEESPLFLSKTGFRNVIFISIGFALMILPNLISIMAYKTIPATKYGRKVGHLILHLIAVLAGGVGVYAAFKYHHEMERYPDIVSLHSWLGIITISLFALQWLVGFLAYFFPGAEKGQRATFLPWHIIFGMFIFILALCTAETGFVQRYNSLVFGRTQEGLIVNFTGLLLLLFAAAVSLTVILPRSS